jgi:hypothetical protein
LGDAIAFPPPGQRSLSREFPKRRSVGVFIPCITLTGPNNVRNSRRPRLEKNKHRVTATFLQLEQLMLLGSTSSLSFRNSSSLSSLRSSSISRSSLNLDGYNGRVFMIWSRIFGKARSLVTLLY